MTPADKAALEKQALAGLHGVAPDHPTFAAVLAFLAVLADAEAEGVCAPGLGEEGRHYNAGRSALSRELPEMLEQFRQRANEPKKP